MKLYTKNILAAAVLIGCATLSGAGAEEKKPGNGSIAPSLPYIVQEQDPWSILDSGLLVYRPPRQNQNERSNYYLFQVLEETEEPRDLKIIEEIARVPSGGEPTHAFIMDAGNHYSVYWVKWKPLFYYFPTEDLKYDMFVDHELSGRRENLHLVDQAAKYEADKIFEPLIDPKGYYGRDSFVDLSVP